MSLIDFKDVKREARSLGGRTIPVAVAPRFHHHGYVATIGLALKSLWDGMRVTWHYLIHPSKVVTQQYPENRATLTFPERYRANLKFKYDPSGYHKCTGCGSCEKACPNFSIRVITRESEITEDREIDRFIWRMDSCMFCNACVQACPWDAIEMGHEFENAVFDRRLLVFNLNRQAGPAASVALEEENPDIRNLMYDPRDVFGGPVPLNGFSLPYMPPLAVTPVPDPAPAYTGFKRDDDEEDADGEEGDVEP